jgi:beta-galactosidase
MPIPGQAAVGQSPALRPTVILDGTWEFATDPDRGGEKEQWFIPSVRWPVMPRPGYAPEADGRIQVPGIWDAQGYGTETDKVRHNFVGLGWYRRQVAVPAEWEHKRVFLYVGGVHRYAKAWVNGRYLGEHVGYLSEFELDITAHVPAGSMATVVLQVDSEQRRGIDTLFGASDLADYMDVAWGGIWGHVRLEARSPLWLSDLFLQPSVENLSCTASAAVNGENLPADHARLEIYDLAGNTRGWAESPIEKPLVPKTVLTLSASLPGATPWSPDSPVLYRARLTLLQQSTVLDAVEDRFGLREIRMAGPFIMLNGKRLFLRGYGDDHIYPERMSMPADKDYHLKRLRLIKSYGFNHVRHHSTIMPPEYYDACDEIGVMPTAEFPIAYDSFLPESESWKKQVPPGTDSAEAFETYRREWTAAIKRHRNHPSILAWVMGNELWNGIPLRHDFRRIAREMDPTRPFADTDGVTEMWQHILDPENDRDTLDLYFLMFDVSRNPLDLPAKFKTSRPIKPIISHESGNYVTFTRPDSIEEFKHNIKPFWMTDGKAKLEELGLLTEADQWAAKSERLYLLLHKTNLEALRKNPYISGYHWWLFQDYWTTANGLVDHYFRPKSITPAEVRHFNNDLVILEDGLDLTYRSRAQLKVRLLLSNFSPNALTNGGLNWRLLLGDRVLASNRQLIRLVGQGELAEAALIDLALPEVTEPMPLKLEAEFTPGAGSANDWRSWLYPEKITRSASPVPVFASRGQRTCWPEFDLQAIPATGPVPERAVYLTGMPDERVLSAVERGACLVLPNGGRHFSSRLLTFRTSWWKAGDDLNANLCGTLVYDHPAIRAMAPEGWCDAGWFHLIEGGRKMTLGQFPKRPRVIIRGLPSLRAVEDEAILFEASLGQGALLVSGLNHQKARGRPENDWVMARLLDYAATLPRPAARWPMSVLPVPPTPPPGNALAGYVKTIKSEGEEGTWYSYREDDVKMLICRQTAPGHLVEWETCPVPKDWKDEPATFVFAGGLGYRTQPKTEGFVFLVNGQEQFRFDLADKYSKWTSPDGRASARFMVFRQLPQDQLGLLFVTLDRGLIKPGEPCRFGVRSLGDGSRRWFGLNPDADLTAED